MQTMDRVGPIRKARAALSRHRGNRSAALVPESPAQLREDQRHEQLNVSTVHGFGDGVAIVVGTQLRRMVTDFSEAPTIADVSSPVVASGGRHALVSLRDGTVAAYRTSDGRRQGEVFPQHAFPLVDLLFRPPFVILAVAGKSDTRDPRSYYDGYIELSRLFHGPSREGSTYARNRPARMWQLPLRGLALASRGGTVVTATDTGFTWFDWGLQIEHTRKLPRIKGVVEALDVAVGPGGSVHGLFSGPAGTELVICPTPTAKLARLSPDIPMPAQLARDSAWTPLPGPDGRVALAPPGHIICFDAEGKVAWQFKRSGAAPALVVEGGILVEHDSALFKLDWGGKFHHVWTAPAPITARPLFHEKHWYVASKVGLHRLK